MNYNFLINGEQTNYSSRQFSVYAPADQTTIAQVPDATEEDLNRAVEAAKQAFPHWRDYAPLEKEKLFWKWAEVLETHANAIGAISGLEGGFHGKEGADALTNYADLIRFYAGFISKNDGDVLNFSNQHLNYVVKEPLGVVVGMVPWNAPVTGAIQKIAPALASGNTMVLRCAEEAPLGTLMLGKTLQESGFPPGVVNIITGNGPASGILLTQHPDVRLVSFTGSVPVGKQIMKSAADSMKRVVLELGGKSPFIVFPDADLEAAAQKAVDFAYIYQGQLCCAVTRILVDKAIQNEFTTLLKSRIAAYQPALPEDALSGPVFGPLMNQKQLKQVEHYVAIGKKAGNCLMGGQSVQSGPFSQGYYYEPTLIEFEDNQSPACREEIFGPVLSIIPFETVEESLQIANDVPYGLSASVWSKNLNTVYQITRGLESGTVWANDYMQFSNNSPWGGVKDSGIGKEYGKYALNSYYYEKNIWLNP